MQQHARHLAATCERRGSAVRKEEEQLPLAAPQIRGGLAVNEDHTRADRPRRTPGLRRRRCGDACPAQLRPRQDRPVWVGRIGRREHNRSRRLGQLAHRAQQVERRGHRELRGAEAGHEVAAADAPRLLHRPEHLVDGGEPAGHRFRRTVSRVMTPCRVSSCCAIAAPHSVAADFVILGTSTADQRPSAVRGTRRRERNGAPPRLRRAARLSSVRTYARSGCSVSLVTRPFQTRSQSASTVSIGKALPGALVNRAKNDAPCCAQIGQDLRGAALDLRRGRARERAAAWRWSVRYSAMRPSRSPSGSTPTQTTSPAAISVSSMSGR